jgi:hypothetical protein
MMQLEADVESTLQSIIYELGLSITSLPWVSSLADFIKDWKYLFGKHVFFREFKLKDGIMCTKSFGQQVGGKEASKWVFYK